MEVEVKKKGQLNFCLDPQAVVAVNWCVIPLKFICQLCQNTSFTRFSLSLSLPLTRSTFLACDSARSPLVGRIVYDISSRQISFHNLMLICFSFFGLSVKSKSMLRSVWCVYLRQPKQFPPNTLINVKQAQQWAAHAHTRTPKLYQTAPHRTVGNKSQTENLLCIQNSRKRCFELVA